jgi:hypothetical protein
MRAGIFLRAKIYARANTSFRTAVILSRCIFSTSHASSTLRDCNRFQRRGSTIVEFTCNFHDPDYGSNCALLRNTKCMSVRPCKSAHGPASHRKQNQLGASQLNCSGVASDQAAAVALRIKAVIGLTRR